MLRYYFDEHVDSAIAKQLRQRGIDVLTTSEAGRAHRGIDDPDQLTYATSLGRVIVTQDADFAVRASKVTSHAGIIWLHKQDSIGKYIEFLEYAAQVLEPEYMQNRLEYYEW